MNLKVLPNELYRITPETPAFLVKVYHNDMDNYLTEIPPVFNRRGRYLLGDKCWFECNGRAFKEDKAQFEYDLGVLHASELSHEVFTALETLRSMTNMMTKDQLRTWRMIQQAAQLRQSSRSALKRKKEIQARMKGRL